MGGDSKHSNTGCHLPSCPPEWEVTAGTVILSPATRGWGGGGEGGDSKHSNTGASHVEEVSHTNTLRLVLATAGVPHYFFIYTSFY